MLALAPMLIGLTIKDVVLIEALDLEVGPGLTVLTGETGAGKSIVLDALGLALGQRADAGLVQAGRSAGADRSQLRPRRPIIPSGPFLEERGFAADPAEPLDAAPPAFRRWAFARLHQRPARQRGGNARSRRAC